MGQREDALIRERIACAMIDLRSRYSDTSGPVQTRAGVLLWLCDNGWYDKGESPVVLSAEDLERVLDEEIEAGRADSRWRK